MRPRIRNKMAVLMLSMMQAVAVTWVGSWVGGGVGEGSAGEGVGSFHSSSPPGTCLPQTPEMGADGEKKRSRELERLGKGQGMGEEMEGEGKGGRERKKGMRESKYRETEIQTDGEEQKRDRD